MQAHVLMGNSMKEGIPGCASVKDELCILIVVLLSIIDGSR